MGGDLGIGSGTHQTQVNLAVLQEYAAQAVQLVADVARRPDSPASELPRVLAGLQRNLAVAKTTPGTAADVALVRSYYGTNHPYGQPIPTDAQLAAYTIDDVRRFHADNFGAKRAHLYIAGQFDTAAVKAAIERAFGDWHAGPDRLWLPAQPQSGPKVLLIDRPGAPQSTIRIAFPAPVIGTEGDLPFRVTNALLGGAFNSRITQNIRERNGYTYSPGSGIAFNPLLLGAMSDVSPSESGLASGVVNTAFMMGGALGLAVLASIAASSTDSQLAAGSTAQAALNGGYQLAFVVGSACAATAGILGGVFMRTRAAPAGAPAPAGH